MTDRFFTRGQERDLDERVVRIVTPSNDTVSESTAQLRSLFRDGYDFRHESTRPLTRPTANRTSLSDGSGYSRV